MTEPVEVPEVESAPGTGKRGRPPGRKNNPDRKPLKLRFRGEMIEPRRSDLRLKQIDLAKKTGMSQAQISQIEGGEKGPGWENFYLIARALGLPMEYFIEVLPMDNEADAS